MRRVGTNFTDRNLIRDYVNAGVTDAVRIGRNLNVIPEAVQGCIDGIQRKNAPEPEVVVEACAPEPEEEAPKPRRKKVPSVET
jgi:hypothetical protein